MGAPKHTIITEDQFVDRFIPEEDDHGNLYVQRDFLTPGDLPLLEAARDERRIWTNPTGFPVRIKY